LRINIRTDIMHHAGLFGKPVLFTNWLIQGWHCYDLRGTRQSPNAKITLVDHAASHHAGTVLSPRSLETGGNGFAPDRRRVLPAEWGNDAGGILRGT